MTLNSGLDVKMALLNPKLELTRKLIPKGFIS
jgi:hypothetical protein